MASSERQVRIYLAGAALSYIGTAVVPVALSFAVLDTGHGASGLGLVLAAQTIPTILLLLLGGIAGDRWSRRSIMIGADLFRALAQAVLAICLISGHAPLGLMVVVSAFIGIGNAFFQPASGGFLTEIVVREQLGRTNGLLRTANALAMVIGPAVGGLVVGAIGPGWGIALDSASYIASAFCLLTIMLPAKAVLPTSGKKSVGKDLVEALHAMRQTKWLFFIVAQYGALNMLAIAPFNVIAPIVLSAKAPHSGGGAGAWGTLLSGIGVGAVFGAFACARRQPRRMLLGVEVAAIMLSAPIFLLAMHASFVLIFAASIIFGVGAAMLSVLTITAIQKEIAPSMLSRTMAMVQLANIGLLPLGYVLAGPALSLLGPTTSLTLSGACVLASVAILLSQPEIRRFEHQQS
jgi:MFS family permease